MIHPKSPEALLKELHDLPFSEPVGEGAFQTLKCPKHYTEQFICREEVEEFMRYAFASVILWVAEEARPKPLKYAEPQESFRQEAFEDYSTALKELAKKI